MSLTKVLPLHLCIAVSSCSFALLHLSPVHALPIFCVAVVGDTLFLRSGASLGPSLLLHGLWNTSQLLAIAYLGKLDFV